MAQAFQGDFEHRYVGRSAPTRLARALELAAEANLNLPMLRAIAAQSRF